MSAHDCCSARVIPLDLIQITSQYIIAGYETYIRLLKTQILISIALRTTRAFQTRCGIRLDASLNG